MLKFQIIIPTLGRSEELFRCLGSLQIASRRFDVSILVLDQNRSPLSFPRELLINLQDRFLVVCSDIAGLSHNRNIGINKYLIKDSFVLFTDDDNVFPINFFSVLSQRILDERFSLYVCRALELETGSSYFGKNVERDYIGLRDYRLVISWNLIVHSSIIESIGEFDERLGVGAMFGSAEESDYFIRALNVTRRARFLNDVCVYHPGQSTNSVNFKRAESYAKGFGALHRKHIRIGRNKAFFILEFLKYTIFNAIKLFLPKYDLNHFKVKYYSLKGKLIGFIKY
jgi:GT2 family glycosyltransferase